MFRYRIVAVAIALLLPISVAEGGAPDETCHASASCAGSKRSLLQTSGGMSHKLPPGLNTLQHQMREDETAVLDHAQRDASTRISESVGMLHSKDRTPHSFSQSLDDLHHRDGSVGLDLTPTKSNIAMGELDTPQQLPHSVGVILHPDADILLSRAPKDAINMLWEKTGSPQEQSASVGPWHQDQNILDPAPSEASKLTFDKAGTPPALPYSVGALGYENVDFRSGQSPTHAQIAMLNDSAKMLDKMATPSKFLQSMGGLGLDEKEENIAMFSQPPTDANTVTLDEAGYQEVAALCCAEDMRTFVKRVATAENLTICDEGGLSGLLWWYDCTDDMASYANLVVSLKNASTGPCSWVGPAGQFCPEMPAGCQLDNPEPLPPCLPKSTTTTTIVGIPGNFRLIVATTTTTTALEATTTTTPQAITLICCAAEPQIGLLQASTLAAPFITVAGNGSHGVSTALLGGTIWKDRDYVFQGLPSVLQGATLFQGPVRTPPGDVLTLNCGGSGGVLYALLSQNRSGTFPTTLVQHGWSKTAESASWGIERKQLGAFDVYKRRGCRTTLPASSGSDVVAAFLHAQEEQALPAVTSRNAVSRTAAFDCSKYTLPIQVWAPSVTDPEYSVSELNVFTGQYQLIYTIPRTITTPAFEQLNSAGISPVDSRAYGTLMLAGGTDYYVVRHDKDGVEFVGRVPPAWTAKGTGYNVAAMSLSGNYYLMTKPKGQFLFVIKGLDSKPGFLNQLPPQGVEDLEPEQKSSKFELGNTGGIADIAAVPMDLDGSGVVTDYVFGLSKTRRLYVVKIGDPNKMWRLEASGNGLTQELARKGFGAAWSYGTRVFMASNTGKGVFEVEMSTIDLTAKTVSMKFVGQSAGTVANDGMNCLDAKSPWPEQGACDDGEVQIDPVNGACPAGSTPK